MKDAAASVDAKKVFQCLLMCRSADSQMFEAKAMKGRAERRVLDAVFRVHAAQYTTTIALKATRCNPPVAQASNDCGHNPGFDLLAQYRQCLERFAASVST